MDTKASQKYRFDDKDAEIEHLKSELTIYKQKVNVLEDLLTQNRSLQTQIDAASTSNELQLAVTE